MIERLRNQLDGDINKLYFTRIVEGIEAIAETDIELTETLNTSGRTLKECWDYIKAKAKTEANNGCACIEDNVVYGWAVEFYKLSNEELEKLKPKKVEPKKTSKEEIKSKNETIQEEINSLDADENNITPISAPKDPIKKKAKEEPTLDGQASIFDFLGV